MDPHNLDFEKNFLMRWVAAWALLCYNSKGLSLYYQGLGLGKQGRTPPPLATVVPAVPLGIWTSQISAPKRDPAIPPPPPPSDERFCKESPCSAIPYKNGHGGRGLFGGLLILTVS